MTQTQAQFIHTEAAAIGRLYNAISFLYGNCKSNCLAYSSHYSAEAICDIWNKLHPKTPLFYSSCLAKAVDHFNFMTKKDIKASQFLDDLTEARKQLN